MENSIKMYDKKKEVVISHTVSMLPKNLHVISFDSEWREVYLGTVRRGRFVGVCPNEVPGGAAKVEVEYKYESIDHYSYHVT